MRLLIIIWIITASGVIKSENYDSKKDAFRAKVQLIASANNVNGIDEINLKRIKELYNVGTKQLAVLINENVFVNSDKQMVHINTIFQDIIQMKTNKLQINELSRNVQTSNLKVHNLLKTGNVYGYKEGNRHEYKNISEQYKSITEKGNVSEEVLGFVRNNFDKDIKEREKNVNESTKSIKSSTNINFDQINFPKLKLNNKTIDNETTKSNKKRDVNLNKNAFSDFEIDAMNSKLNEDTKKHYINALARRLATDEEKRDFIRKSLNDYITKSNVTEESQESTIEGIEKYRKDEKNGQNRAQFSKKANENVKSREKNKNMDSKKDKLQRTNRFDQTKSPEKPKLDNESKMKSNRQFVTNAPQSNTNKKQKTNSKMAKNNQQTKIVYTNHVHMPYTVLEQEDNLYTDRNGIKSEKYAKNEIKLNNKQLKGQNAGLPRIKYSQGYNKIKESKDAPGSHQDTTNNDHKKDLDTYAIRHDASLEKKTNEHNTTPFPKITLKQQRKSQNNKAIPKSETKSEISSKKGNPDGLHVHKVKGGKGNKLKKGRNLNLKYADFASTKDLKVKKGRKKWSKVKQQRKENYETELKKAMELSDLLNRLLSEQLSETLIQDIEVARASEAFNPGFHSDSYDYEQFVK